jgi:hypothetical protein
MKEIVTRKGRVARKIWKKTGGILYIHSRAEYAHIYQYSFRPW